ncbi:10314_t:CDS:2, partial [Racocetra fulgida]
AQDPFRPISNMQIPTTLNNFQESASSQSIDNSTTSDQVNSAQNYNNSVHDNTLEIAVNMPHSVCRRNTTRIQNKCRTPTKA